MLKSTVIFSFLVLILVTHYAELSPVPAPIPGWPGLNFHFGFGGDGSGKSGGKSSGEIGGGGSEKSGGKSSGEIGGGGSGKSDGKFSGEIGGGSSGKSDGKSSGGGSGESSGVIGGSASFLGSTIESLISVPIKLPFKIAKMPIAMLRKIITLVLAAVQDGMKFGISGVGKIGSMNVEVVSGAMNVAKTALGKIVRGVTNTNIFGIQVGYSVGEWFAGRVSGAVDGVLKMMTWSLAKVGAAADGSIQIMHVKDILQLPVLKQMVGVFQNIIHWNKKQIYANYNELSIFIGSVIYEHKDFFIPLFQKMLNIFLAITDALQQINGGGEFTGIAATFGKLKVSLVPIMSGNWEIDDGGKTIKGGSAGNKGGIVLGGTENGGTGDSSKGGSGNSHSSSGGSAWMGQGSSGGGKSSAGGSGHGSSGGGEGWESSKGGSGKSSGSGWMGQGSSGGGKSSAGGSGHGSFGVGGGWDFSGSDESSKGMSGHKGSDDDCDEDGNGKSSGGHIKQDGKGSTKG